MAYSPLEKLNIFINAYGRLFAALFRIGTWSPFLILALFQTAGLVALKDYYMPGYDQIIYPILAALLPSSIFHYPQYYLALPSIYAGYSTFILGPTVWVVMSAAAVYKLDGYQGGTKRRLGEAIGRAFRSFFPLLLFWIIHTVIIMSVLTILSYLFQSAVLASPRLKFVFEFVYHLIAFIFSAFLLYTIPAVIISGKGIAGAIAESLRVCGRNLFLTYFIVAIPGSVGAIIDLFISDFTPRIIALFNPGLIPILLIVGIVLGIFINLFTYGAAVFVYKKIGKNR